MKAKKDKSKAIPDTSQKKDGVTSIFSAATGDAGKYGGEDIDEVKGSVGNDADKIADSANDNPAGKS